MRCLMICLRQGNDGGTANNDMKIPIHEQTQQVPMHCNGPGEHFMSISCLIQTAMNSVNVLFAASAVLVSLLLISINHSAISDFYAYSTSMNSLVVERGVYSEDPDTFSKMQSSKDATCFTTPPGNVFCYGKPLMHQRSGNSTAPDRMSGVSHVTSAAGINGELHLDQVGGKGPYFTMKKITRIHGDTVSITFADNNYNAGLLRNGTAVYMITDKFEFSATVQKYDTFITHCGNYQGTVVHLVQYAGMTTVEGVDYFVTWHTLATSEKGIACDYPEIIRASLGHDFGI